MLFSFAIATTSVNLWILSAIEHFMFFYVNASLAAPKTAISLTPCSKALDIPFVLGTSTG